MDSKFMFIKGINLGGWLSQCNHSDDHYNSFIQKKDFETTKAWGCDHVRIPIDYELLETSEGIPIESGYQLLQKALSWCKEYDLKMILDLHKTFGFSFDPGEHEEGFFQSSACQERFYQLWERISQYFINDSDSVAFELLNEITDPSYSDTWNRVASECVRRIRKYIPDVFILIGGYQNNSVHALKDLEIPSDNRIIYNFHCYDPLIFTHQGAYWIPTMDTEFRISVKSSFRELTASTEKFIPKGARNYTGFLPELSLDSSYFEKLFADAIEISKARNVALYCGEYGVIDRAKPEEILYWYKMIHSVFEKYGIGRAAWSYKAMDFGIQDSRMNNVRKELIQCL